MENTPVFIILRGGHLGTKENENSFLTRKIFQELGIKVTPQEKIATTPADIKNGLVHWLNCNIITEKIKADPSRISNYKWFTRKEILKSHKIWPATKKFFQQFISD